MKHALALAALTLGIAHAADLPVTSPVASPKMEQAATAKGGDPALIKKKKMRKKSGTDKRADSATVRATSAPPGVDPGLEVLSARTRSATGATPMTGTRGISAGAPSSQPDPAPGLEVPPARSRPGAQGTPMTGTRGIKLKSGEAADKSKTDPPTANKDDTTSGKKRAD